MKKIWIYSLAFVFVLSSFVVKKKYKRLKIGEKSSMTNVKMKATDGNKYSLSDLKKKNGLVVIFSANTCPFVVGGNSMEGWQGRYNDVYKTAKDNQIGMIVINSNEKLRADEDSFDSMKARSKKQGYQFKYVVDKQSKLANSYGASTTPDVFLFDKDFKLVYMGAIDDSYKSAKDVKDHYLKKAIKHLAEGKKIKKSVTRNVGCSIKRK